jgi:hypothetical protein
VRHKGVRSQMGRPIWTEQAKPLPICTEGCHVVSIVQGRCSSCIRRAASGGGSVRLTSTPASAAPRPPARAATAAATTRYAIPRTQNCVDLTEPPIWWDMQRRSHPRPRLKLPGVYLAWCAGVPVCDDSLPGCPSWCLLSAGGGPGPAVGSQHATAPARGQQQRARTVLECRGRGTSTIRHEG